MDSQPLILTLKIDNKSFEFFNKLRKEHFPAKINYLDAHLTLFHHLPDLAEIKNYLLDLSSHQQNLNINVIGLMKLGGGVAFKLESNELVKIHLELQKKWEQFLIPQDKQKLRPHITVQNKVKPEQALILFEKLENEFQPFKINGIGFNLWRYLGGPWEKITDYYFQ